MLLRAPLLSVSTEYDASGAAQTIAAAAVEWFQHVFPGSVEWKRISIAKTRGEVVKRLRGPIFLSLCFGRWAGPSS
jgi:hypothetical protein